MSPFSEQTPSATDGVVAFERKEGEGLRGLAERHT
jgi:hypothetical protein